MKRILNLFLATLLIIGIFTAIPIQVSAETTSINDLRFGYNKVTDTYQVIGCAEDISGEVIIPSTYNNKPVTEIFPNSFMYKKNITSVVIPDTITFISSSAFEGCAGLTSIIIPDSVKEIGFNAFKDCFNLKEATLPEGLEVISSKLFDRCLKLESIVIPNSVTTIKAGAFNSCESLKSITIPEGVITIEKAFTDCIALEKITLPKTLQHLDSQCFANSAYVENEENWDGIALYIDNILVCTKTDSASTNNVESYAIKPGTNVLATNLFYGYNNLKTINFPESLEHIGKNCFKNCPKLQNFTFPSKLKTIGENSFSNCRGITEVTIPGTVEHLEPGIFASCNYLRTLTIKEGTKSIAYQSFYNCMALYNVTLPDSLTDIPANMFEGTSVKSNDKLWDVNVCYLGNHLIATRHTLPTFYAIKPGTVSISDNTFYTSDTLQGLRIPKSVKVIGERALPRGSQFNLIIYEGTRAEFDKIEITGESAEIIKKVKIYTTENSAKAPKTPVVKSVINIAGGVQITWNKVANADSYIVWRRGAGTSDWTALGVTNKTTFTDEFPPHRQYWRYSVQAINANGLSDFDYTGKYLKYIATPKLTGISNATNGIYVKWNAVSGASGYRVYRRGAGEKYWTYVTTVKGTGYTDTAVKNSNGNYYRYTVRAVVDGVYSGFEGGIYIKRLANPTLKSATSSSNGITVKWSPIKGTTGYYVYRKTANSNWVRVGAVGGTNNTTFVDKTAKKGTTYTYTVRAVYGSTLSYFNSGIKCKRK